MKRYIFSLCMLLVMTGNLSAAAPIEDDSEKKPSVQAKIERIAGLASAVALGCVSGYFCAKLYPIVGKKIERDLAAIISNHYWDTWKCEKNSEWSSFISDLYWKNGEKNIALCLYLFLWSIPESAASGYLIKELKELEIDHNPQFMRFACSISSWITFLLA